jgi:hypothetical protein
MTTLALKECLEFAEFAVSKIESLGWLEILKEFSLSGNNNVGQAIGQWFNNLRNGQTYQESVANMQIRFPSSIESLLVLGIENSILDVVLRDMVSILKKNDGTAPASKALDLLLRQLSQNPKSPFICLGCLMRELERIVARATLEKAREIVFEQDGERYFIQRYLGPKVVTYIEPCHSKIYNTLVKQFADWTKNKERVRLLECEFTVDRIAENIYRLTNPDHFFDFSFERKQSPAPAAQNHA